MLKSNENLLEFWEHEVRPFLTVELVYSAVQWKTHGSRYWRGPCPLHGGEEANFSVDSQTLNWRCFSRCGSGTVFDFLKGGQPAKGKEWVEALRELASLAGVRFPTHEVSAQELEQVERTRRRNSLFEEFETFCRDALLSPAGQAGREYLVNERGFSNEQLAEVSLGFYTSISSVVAHLKERGFSSEEIERSKVATDNRWAGRLVIPWRDARGRLGTFAARDLQGDAPGGQKYLYLARSEEFARPKSELIAFGLDVAVSRASGVLTTHKPLILVEGLLDVVAMQARGVLNIAAIGGSGRELSEARWHALSTLGVREAILILDNDAKLDGSWPGREGAIHALEAALCSRQKGDNVVNSDDGENVPVISILPPQFLTPCKDPDEWVQRFGVESFLELLENRQTGAAFLSEVLMEGVSPQSGDGARRAALEIVFNLASRFRGSRAALDRESALGLAAKRTGFDEQTVLQIGEDAAQKRHHEEATARLDEAVKNAARERAAGREAAQVAGELEARLAQWRTLIVEAPPPFSVERLEQQSRRQPAGKSSGWTALDETGVQFGAGELGVVAARTGHGKTSFLVALLANWMDGVLPSSRKQNGDEILLFYSAEEPEVRIYQRLLALLAAHSRGELKEPGWTVAEVRDYLRDPFCRGESYGWPHARTLDAARSTLRHWEGRLQIVFRPEWSAADIAAHALQCRRKNPIGGVFVDYLQRLPSPAGRFDRRDQEVSAIGRRFKSLAVELEAPVIAGAQINREAIPEGYAKQMNAAGSYEAAKKTIRNARPELHNLREGGSEQEADMVLGLLNYAGDYRGETPAPATTLMEVGALKNRNGEPGKWASLAFEGRYGLIRQPQNDEII